MVYLKQKDSRRHKIKKGILKLFNAVISNFQICSGINAWIILFSVCFIITDSQAQDLQMMLPVGHSYPITKCSFIADNQYAFTQSASFKESKIWELPSGKVVKSFSAIVVFNETGDRFALQRKDTIEIWAMNPYSKASEIVTGSSLSDISFTRDGKMITGLTADTLRFFNIESGKCVQTLASTDEYELSPDNTNLLSFNRTQPCNPELRNVQNGKPISLLDEVRNIKRGFLPIIKEVKFSDDSRIMVINIWQMPGKMQNDGYSLSSDGGYSELYLIEAGSGKILSQKKFKYYVQSFLISSDGEKLITGDEKGSCTIWDVVSGRELHTIKNKSQITSLGITPDNSILAIGSQNGEIDLLNLKEYKITNLSHKHSMAIRSLSFSTDNSLLISGSDDRTAGVWQLNDYNIVVELRGHCSEIQTLFLSPNGQFIGVVEAISKQTEKNQPQIISFSIWDGINGIPVMKDTAVIGDNFHFEGYSWGVRNYLYRGNLNGQPFMWQGYSGERLFGALGSVIINPRYRSSINVFDKYSFMLFDSNDYLVFDTKGRFDGTETARRMMYFVEGLNIVELNQVKDQLWVPGLAQRLVKGETIYSKGFDEINLYNQAPEVRPTGRINDELHYKIYPGKGGLGDCLVFINGIEAFRISKESLIPIDNYFNLVLNISNLQPYFLDGSENEVVIKALTNDNNIISRGAKSKVVSKDTTTVMPNLYAVFVGVSDYKGDVLDLKYAAKDASDISNAIEISAKKLLNTDGKEHVFIFRLTTNTDRDAFPEKKGIHNILEEIGSKANANDIILIFFAGHGVMDPNQKQFYFLTAEASGFSNASESGISTSELSEWIKPGNIKAQKRILIFDACNSGQAINDLVKIGSENQNYLAARSDLKSEQIKAIDKLNEKSGLFILSASSSDQSAYEMGQFAQGVLTYSLLRAIKENPEVLENGKYLNVSRWFHSAESTVSEIARENGARQDPQVVSNTNFNIGLVDADVIHKIQLPKPKVAFGSANFQNADDAIADDNLSFTQMLNNQLQTLASRGVESSIVFSTTQISEDVYSLSGRYSVDGNAIKVLVNIKKGGQIINRFEISGTSDQLVNLSEQIIQKAIEFAQNNAKDK
ncbi:MAG: hypothetical protein GC181_10145 [Bacteroidetes bacterium]|nr:hypothetical protein [Bacteroidota bacterium]